MTEDQFNAIFHGLDLFDYQKDALRWRINGLLSASIADTATHKLVPIEPTLEMQYAAIDTGCCTRPTDTYAAMLAAAPEVIADTAPKAHAIDCEYIQDDNPWARCTCGVGGPNDGRKSIADTAGAIPEGWKLVPIEAPLEFLQAVAGRGICCGGTPMPELVDKAKDRWAHILSRAPAPPAPSVADIEDPVIAPRDLLIAACSAIDKKRNAPNTLAALRAITMAPRSAPSVADAAGASDTEPETE